MADETWTLTLVHDVTPDVAILQPIERLVKDASDGKVLVRDVRSDRVGAEPISLMVITVAILTNVAGSAIVAVIQQMISDRRTQAANDALLKALAIDYLAKMGKVGLEVVSVQPEEGALEVSIKDATGVTQVVRIARNGHILHNTQ